MKNLLLSVILPVWNRYLGWLEKTHIPRYERVKEWEDGVKVDWQWFKASVDLIKAHTETITYIEPKGCHAKLRETYPGTVASFEIPVDPVYAIKTLTVGLSTEDATILDSDITSGYILFQKTTQMKAPVYYSVQITRNSEDVSLLEVGVLSKYYGSQKYLGATGYSFRTSLDDGITSIKRVLSLGDNAATVAQTQALVHSQNKNTQVLNKQMKNQGCMGCGCLIVVLILLLMLLSAGL
nr:hypothetical protein 13 [Candidatus Hydrogenedentota bacterium]